MNIQIVTACPGGKTTSWLGARRLAAAADRRGWLAEIVDTSRPLAAPARSVDCVIVATSTPLDLAALDGTCVYRAELRDALAAPDRLLAAAEHDGAIYRHADESQAANAPVETACGTRRIVAITACPTG
ncbi:MAG: hypothetical protein PF501_13440, partial [Salinisphaera sp.]|nr:hypothetical protein [Salinisphaera sp.]